MWTPFRIDRMRLIEIRIQVNGRRAVAVVDTGATRTSLDRSFAERIGILAHAAFQGLGLTAAISGGVAADIEMEVAGRRLTGVNPAVLDLSSLASAIGHPVEVILGRELFEASLVELDFPRSRLRLQPSGMESEGGTPLRLGATSDGLRTLPLRIGNHPIVEAALDLGSNVPLYLHPDLAERTRLIEGLRTSTAASAGAEGIEVSRVAVLPLIEIAGAHMRNVPVQVPRTWRFASQALIGLPVLSRFRLGWDFRRSLVFVQPEPTVLETPFPKDRSGLGAVPAEGRLRIIHVARGSPAQRSGFMPGDEIVVVNGRIIDEEYLRERPRIGQSPAGTVVMLELASGETRRLTLEDYF